MSKFDVTGQVAGISYTDAEKAKASGAVTDAGYLGGTSWIKTQHDAAREFSKNGISQFQQLEFADAIEGLAIPDGEFDFFDKTFNLTNKGVTDLLVGFKHKSSAANPDRQTPRDSAGTPLPLYLNSAMFTTDGNGGITTNAIGGGTLTIGNGGNTQGPIVTSTTFLVNADYTKCGPYGTTYTARSSGIFSADAWGTNPPPTDTGGMADPNRYHQPGDAGEKAQFGFWQYGDSTDSKAGFRYMIGLYDGTSALSSEASQDYVVKSMSINTTAAGVNQLVLHFRKTAVTSGVSMNQPDILITTLKINL